LGEKIGNIKRTHKGKSTSKEKGKDSITGGKKIDVWGKDLLRMRQVKRLRAGRGSSKRENFFRLPRTRRGWPKQKKIPARQQRSGGERGGKVKKGESATSVPQKKILNENEKRLGGKNAARSGTRRRRVMTGERPQMGGGKKGGAAGRPEKGK